MESLLLLPVAAVVAVAVATPEIDELANLPTTQAAANHPTTPV
jgi:hypothetical protein